MEAGKWKDLLPYERGLQQCVLLNWEECEWGGQRIGWTVELEALWSVAKCPAGGKWPAVCPRGQYCCQYCLRSLSMTFVMGHSVPSTSSHMIKTGRCSWHAMRSCCLSEGPQQAGRMGQRERHGVQQSKCQVLLLVKNNLRHRYRLGANRLESSSAKKGLVGSKLTTGQQRALIAKDNSLLGCIRKGVASKLREVNRGFPLFNPGETHLECLNQWWAPQDKTDMEWVQPCLVMTIGHGPWLWASIQATVRTNSLEHLPYEAERDGRAIQPGEQKAQRDLINVYKYWKRGSKESRVSFSSSERQDRRQWTQVKIQESAFKHRKNFSTLIVFRHWHRLPRETVDSPSLEIFKTWLDMHFLFLDLHHLWQSITLGWGSAYQSRFQFLLDFSTFFSISTVSAPFPICPIFHDRETQSVFLS